MTDYRCSIQGHIFIIPAHLIDMLKKYIYEGRDPGGFLLAVLENNLKEACMFADEFNILLLPAYANFLYNEAPANCWGSKEEVAAWIKNIKEVKT